MHGNATLDARDADFVLTMPYAPLPMHLRSRPMVVLQFTHRAPQMVEWCGAELTPLSSWNRGREQAWVGNAEVRPVNLCGLVPDAGGWFPLELPLRVLEEYARPGMTVWDGFMGRGTVGRACRLLGLNFVGMDARADRVALAREWI